VDAILAEARRRRPCQLERVDLARRRVVAARLDPRGERQLVDQLRKLRSRSIDHLDVPVGRRLQASGAHERRREAVNRRQRRAQVVARERDESGEVVVVDHGSNLTGWNVPRPPISRPVRRRWR
jgi:hypothetical protein